MPGDPEAYLGSPNAVAHPILTCPQITAQIFQRKKCSPMFYLGHTKKTDQSEDELMQRF